MHTINTTVDIPICLLMEDIKAAMIEDAEMQMLKWYIIRRWPHTKDELEPGLEGSWLIRHRFAMIDGIAMKGKWIIVPYLLQKQQSHGHLDNVTPSESVSILDQHGYWHREDSKSMCHVLRIPMHTVTGNSTTWWNTIQAMGRSLCWHIHGE